MRVLLVSNRASGSSDDATLERVGDVLRELGEVSGLSPASYDSMPDELAAATDGVDLVVVAGGDGTFNGAVNALQSRFRDVALALVPMGTGNDLARTLGVPDEPIDAARGLLRARARVIDVAKATGPGVERLFVNACMGGFPVDVNEVIEGADLKRRLGPLAFWVGGLKAAADVTRFSVDMDGVSIEDCLAVGVGNGKTCGGGIPVWPSARIDDRLLRGCALGARNAAAAVALAARVRSGTHEELDGVRSVDGRSIQIRAAPAVEFNVDGELVGLATPATFEIVDRLQMRVPAAR